MEAPDGSHESERALEHIPCDVHLDAQFGDTDGLRERVYQLMEPELWASSLMEASDEEA
jgi:hypothetical protein